MNPLSINPLMLLGAGAMALALGFGSGWTTNGWRLDGAHQHTLAEKKGEYDALASTVREQNRAVEKMGDATIAADGRRKVAEAFAKSAIDRSRERGNAAAASKATNCDGVMREAWEGWK